MIAAALILALGVPDEPIKLACTFGYDSDAARTTKVGITLGGPRHVSFDDAEHLLGDDSGTLSPNRRGWSVKRRDRRGVSTILLRSRVGVTGHGAEVELTRNAAGQFTGRYYVNQGMLSESVAFGANGPVTCEVVA